MSDNLALASSVENGHELFRVRALIFTEINAERQAQDAQWGGKEHDDDHERFDWSPWIAKQNTKASQSYMRPEEFESRMVKVAALAVAAIESSRRKRQARSANAGESQAPNEHSEERQNEKDAVEGR